MFSVFKNLCSRPLPLRYLSRRIETNENNKFAKVVAIGITKRTNSGYTEIQLAIINVREQNITLYNEFMKKGLDADYSIDEKDIEQLNKFKLLDQNGDIPPKVQEAYNSVINAIKEKRFFIGVVV